MIKASHTNAPLRILIADGSAFFRQLLTKSLETDGLIRVAAIARTGPEVLEKLSAGIDLAVLDVALPLMNGPEVLHALRARGVSCRVLMVSSVSGAGAREMLFAFEEGADDFIVKPDELAGEVGTAFLHSIRAKILSLKLPVRPSEQVPPSPASAEPSAVRGPAHDDIQLVALGSSTGGPRALHTILGALPRDFPVPLAISQHMPPLFTAHLAQDLGKSCGINVVEAQNDMWLEPGHAVLAPGGGNLEIFRRGDHFKCGLAATDPRSSVPSPNVDVMFSSLVPSAPRVLAVLLTGLGHDGAEGLLKLRRAGAWTLAQDEESSTVYGMPRVAAECGAVDEILPLDRMAGRIRELTERIRKS